MVGQTGEGAQYVLHVENALRASVNGDAGFIDLSQDVHPRFEDGTG